MPDTALTEPRNVSIGLKQRVARFIKMELVFSNVWISISEITFSSSLAEGSFKKESILRINSIESTTKNLTTSKEGQRMAETQRHSLKILNQHAPPNTKKSTM